MSSYSCAEEAPTIFDLLVHRTRYQEGAVQAGPGHPCNRLACTNSPRCGPGAPRFGRTVRCPAPKGSLTSTRAASADLCCLFQSTANLGNTLDSAAEPNCYAGFGGFGCMG